MLIRALPVLLITLALAAPARAATELGETSSTGISCAGGLLAWMTSPPYVAPTAGVITELRGTLGIAEKRLAVKVVRPGGTPAIVGTTPLLTVQTANAPVTAAVRIPVQAGDALGVWVESSTPCAASRPGATGAGVPGSANPGPGPVSGTVTPTTNNGLAIAGTLEPDADNDQYGDETQDSCPVSAAIHEGVCARDAQLAATAVPAAIEVGDVSVLDLRASSPAGVPILGATVGTTLPAGLEPVLAFPGTCAPASVFTCGLGDYTGTGAAALVVRATAPGSYSVPVALTTTSTDLNSANNAVSVPLSVSAKPVIIASCRVPKLKGRTKSFAKALLKAAGCKLGTVKRKRVRKGRDGVVRVQTVRAGTRVPAGTAVGITLNRRRR